jgi:transcription elongation factor Elf1
MENIKLDELPILKKTFECPHCGKKYKSKKSFEKHVESCEFQLEEPEHEIEQYEQYEHDEQLEIDQDNAKVEKLKNELRNLLMANPTLDLTKSINKAPLELINHMSNEELQARIFDAKRTLNSKLDNNISSSGLCLVNQVVGKLLGCVEELDQFVSNDKVLQESAKDLLSFNLLSHIPPSVKVSGLYAMNVGLALKEKNKKAKVNISE